MSLECINTSSRYEDIINHLKYITPDVFVYCLYGESPDDIKRFANVEHKFTEQDILIVDDDSSVLKLLKTYLGERYDVATAINGKVAMKFLESKRTDLVLLDYEMPGENGATVLSQIRDNPRTQNLPVIFLTGVTVRAKIQEVLALKIQGYLLKPIDMEKVASTIKGVLG